MSRYRVQFTPAALKQLDQIDRAQVLRIRGFFVQRLDLDNPRSLGQPLQGRSEWRYRVGDHRVLCLIKDDLLLVLIVAVAHRDRLAVLSQAQAARRSSAL